MTIDSLAVPVAADVGNVLGEMPFWSARERALYWIDVRRPAVFRLEGGRGDPEVFELPELVGAVLPRGNGELLLCLGSGVYAFDPEPRRLSFLVAPEVNAPTAHRLNDSRCDRKGRLFCTSMWDFGKANTGSIYQVLPDLSVRMVRHPVRFPNAIGFSPDNRTIYFADSGIGAIEQAPYDIETGEVGEWATLVAPGVLPGVPDGAVVDADGYIWNARFGGGCVARIAPEGSIDRLVPMPVSRPTACAFGGEDLSSLFVTTARQGLSEEQLRNEPLAGAVFRLETGCRGLPEAEFEG